MKTFDIEFRGVPALVCWNSTEAYVLVDGLTVLDLTVAEEQQLNDAVMEATTP
jgi:hypothetical protein